MFARRHPLPPPRALPWPLKPLAGAQSSLDYDDHGRMVMRIRHDPIRGVTPRMILWWFKNIGGEMDLDGVRLNKYLVWHPFDHIHWDLARPAPDGSIGPGARFHIVEAFGRDPANYIDVTETILRLDETGITLEGRRLGLQASRLNHDFTAVPEGTLYESTLTIGVAAPPVGRGVNRLLHRAIFPESKGRAWIKHNIEEVGLFEHLLPRLYPRDAASA